MTNNEKLEKLKQIIIKLHKGENVEKVKKEFSKLIKNVTAEEISELEMSLLNEGIKPEEIQKLCELHVTVFEKALLKQKNIKKIGDHPVNTYLLENKEAKKILNKTKKLAKLLLKGKEEKRIEFKKAFDSLKQIEIHYKRKENQLFPFLEKKGFTGPSKVMWGKHDEIRGMIKEIEKLFEEKNYKQLYNSFKKLNFAIKRMIFMEEKILFPTAIAKLSKSDWVSIRVGEKDIGYAWIKPLSLYDEEILKNQIKEEKISSPSNESKKLIKLEEGEISEEIINLILKNLHIDISYVDENDTVRYYSATEERIFPRSPGVIGRKVQNCHPPKSIDVVNKILDAFRKKEKKEAEFWINLHGKLIYIRYFPLYDKEGNYKGVIEVTQDITRIKQLEGEKRLLNWD